MSAYRIAPPAPDSPEQVIGRLDVASQLFRAAAYVAVVGAWAWLLGTGGFLPLLNVLSLPLVWGVARRIQACVIRSELRLDGHGVHLRYGAPVPLRPWLRVVDRTIPWDQLVEIEVRDFRVNGLSSYALVFRTTGGEMRVEPGIFEPNGRVLQERILDYVHVQFEAPARDAAPVAQFCRQRFARPVRIDSRKQSLAVDVGQAAVLGGLPVAGLVYSFPEGWPVWICWPALIVVLLVLARIRSYRFVELGSEGVAVGRRGPAVRVLPWEQIDVARRTITSGKTTSLEIRTRDGQRLVLGASFERPLEEIADLVYPPLEKLRVALAHVADGCDVEEAAKRARLPRR